MIDNTWHKPQISAPFITTLPARESQALCVNSLTFLTKAFIHFGASCMRMCRQKCLHYTLFHYLLAKYNSTFFELFFNAFGADNTKKIDNVVIHCSKALTVCAENSMPVSSKFWICRTCSCINIFKVVQCTEECS